MEVMSPGSLLRIDQEFTQFSENIVGYDFSNPRNEWRVSGSGRASEVIGHASNYGQGRGRDRQQRGNFDVQLHYGKRHTHSHRAVFPGDERGTEGGELKLAIFIPS